MSPYHFTPLRSNIFPLNKYFKSYHMNFSQSNDQTEIHTKTFTSQLSEKTDAPILKRLCEGNTIKITVYKKYTYHLY